MAMQVIIFFSFFAFLFTLMREIVKDCEDIEGDKQNGVRSIPVKIGLMKTNIIVAVIALISAFAVVFFWFYYLSRTRFFMFESAPVFYLGAFVLLPTIVCGVISLFGTAKRKYSFLSAALKCIMVIGIAFSIVFCHIVLSNGNI